MLRSAIRRANVPWFVDSTPLQRQLPPHIQTINGHPLPDGIPKSIKDLHIALKGSPHLEPSELVVCEPIPTAPGPALPDAMPKGRRKRGRTYVGEGTSEELSGGIWNWIVIAQVKEGTEGRGAIEAVTRIVRKSLLEARPSLPLPPNSKRRVEDGWAMIDAGEFAVHILSKDARAKFFPAGRRDFVPLV